MSTVDIEILPARYEKLLNSSEIVLSTMTLDGLLSNIKFDKETSIEHLQVLGNVVEIGCNFGYKVSDQYVTMQCFKDRKKKEKQTEPGAKSKRSQGLGTHFNSQITFTIITDRDTANSYQIKLFTNGRLQIPGIGKLSKNNEALLDDIISTMISYVLHFPNVLLLRPQALVDIQYLTPILQNFKAVTLLADDCMMEVRIGKDKDGKEFQMIPCLDLSIFETKLIEALEVRRPPFPIDNIIFNPQRYSGLLIKFSTPKVIEETNTSNKFIELIKLYYHMKVKKEKLPNPIIAETDAPIVKVVKLIQQKWFENSKGSKKLRKKLTTVKAFRSGKINIDHVNNLEQAVMIRAFIVSIIRDYWYDIVYYVDDHDDYVIYTCAQNPIRTSKHIHA